MTTLISITNKGEGIVVVTTVNTSRESIEAPPIGHVDYRIAPGETHEYHLYAGRFVNINELPSGEAP